MVLLMGPWTPGSTHQLRLVVEIPLFIHSRKLTWNLKMMVSNRNLLFQVSIFGCHVSFRECRGFSTIPGGWEWDFNSQPWPTLRSRPWWFGGCLIWRNPGWNTRKPEARLGSYMYISILYIYIFMYEIQPKMRAFECLDFFFCEVTSH